MSQPHGLNSHRQTVLRRRLMTGGAMALCLAALVSHAPLAAQTSVGGQAFQGTPNVVSGGATVNQTATTDTITVTTPQAVINWTPNDRNGTGTIDFLPSGLTGLFQGNQEFTVLNRVIPLDGNDLPVLRMIALNGIIQSQIVDPVTGATSAGGNVWFYSPGGILVGSSGVINVGSLVLSARDIDTTGGLFGSNGQIRFRDPSIAGAGTSRIEIAPGASVYAGRTDGSNSYIAMVAPRIVQSGNVDVLGSVGLVAAEQADVRINNGLFDISVTVGTGDANGIVHTGTTGGVLDTSGNHYAYLVAIPKNQAMTMMLGGTIGFAQGQNASVNASGNIVISAGHNVNETVFGAAPNSNTTGSIRISDSIFRNALSGRASDAITVRPVDACAPIFCSTFSTTGQVQFMGDTTLNARRAVNLSVGQAQRIVASGNLSLLSATTGTGGSVTVTTDATPSTDPSTSGGGLITVTGALLLDASARGDSSINNGNAIGGTATLTALQGTISAATIDVRANAVGGRTALNNGADGTGGTARVSAGQGGVISTGSLNVNADGSGDDTPFGRPIGGAGTGGLAEILLTNGGGLSATGAVTASASGAGQFANETSGNGTGGTVRLLVDDASTYTAGQTGVVALGSGGGSLGELNSLSSAPDTAIGGSGNGGSITIDSRGTANFGNLIINASGAGGDAAISTGVGGSSRGGDIALLISGGTATVDTLDLNASAVGGNSGGTAGGTGAATGGGVTIDVIGSGRLTARGAVNAQANGHVLNANGGTVAAATGGTVSLRARFGGVFDAQFGVNVDAIGTSRRDSFAPAAVSAAAASGGTVAIEANEGTMTLAGLVVAANGVGADAGAVGGNGIGGTIQLLSANDGSLTINPFQSDFSSRFSANGVAGAGQRGGTGSGGIIGITVDGGTISSTTFGQFFATGFGGQSFDGTSLGRGDGGIISLTVTENGISVLDFSSIDLIAGADTSIGGEGFINLGDGAEGRGGAITLQFDGGTVTVGNLVADATGRGVGRGDGYGGTVDFNMTAGDVEIGFLTLRADGRSSNQLFSSVGGNGFGGEISVDFGGGSYTGSTVFVGAQGSGGDGLSAFSEAPFTGGEGSGGGGQGGGGPSFDVFGGFAGPYVTGQYNAPSNGGDGFGGTANIHIFGDAQINLTSGLFADTRGIGGEGGNAFADPFTEARTPGNGGTGTGGTIEFLYESGTFTGASSGNLNINLSSLGVGGEGGRLFVDPTGSFSCGFFSCGEGFGNGEGGVVSLPTAMTRPNGGTGTGGTVNVTLLAAPQNVSFFASSTGIGGRGGFALSGGNGGLGVGGTSTLIVEDAEVDAVTVTLVSEGFGGFGGGAINGSGGNGGEGRGGTAQIFARGENASVNTGNASLSTAGFGGNGGNGAVSQYAQTLPEIGYAGGNGGEGRGGTIELIAEGGSLVIGANGEGATIISSARGGNGGDGADNVSGHGTTPSFGGNAGFGGGGFGGTVNLLALGGTVSVESSEDLTIDVSAERGRGAIGGDGNVVTTFDMMGMPTGTAGGSGFSTGDSFTFAGNIIISASDTESGLGLVQLGNVRLLADGDIAGRISLLDNSSGSGIEIDNLTAFARGAPAVGNDFTLVGSGIYVFSTDGSISIGGDATLETDGDIQVDADGTGGLSVAGAFVASADGDFRANHAGGDANPTIDARSMDILANNIVFGTGSRAHADTSILFNAGNLINFDTIVAADGPVLLLAGGNITGGTAETGGLFSTNSGGNTRVDSVDAGTNADMRATGSLTVGNVTTGGFAGLVGAGVSLTSGDVGTNLSIDGTTGNVNLGTAVAGNDATVFGQAITITSLTATMGDIRIKQDTGLTAGTLLAGDDIDVSGDGNVTIASAIGGGNLYIFSESNLSLGFARGATGEIGAFGTVNFGEINTTDQLELFGNGGITGNIVRAGTAEVRSSNAGINIGSITSQDLLTLTALNGLITGNMARTQNGDILISGASVDYGSLIAGGLLQVDASGAIRVTNSNSMETRLTAGTNITVGNANSSGPIILLAGGTIGAGPVTTSGLFSTNSGGVTTLDTVTAGSADIRSGTTLAFNAITTTGLANIVGASGITGMRVSAGSLTGTSDNGGIAIGMIDAGSSITLTALRGAVTGTSAIGRFGSIVLNGATVTYGTLDAGGRIDVSAAGNINLTSGITRNTGSQAPGSTGSFDIMLNAGGTISAGPVTTSGLFSTNSGGATTLDTVTASRADIRSGSTLAFNGITTTGLANIVGASGITGMRVTAGSLTGTSDNGGIAIGMIDAGSSITLTALRGAVTGTSAIGRFGSIVLNGATVTYGTLDAGGRIDVSSAGNINLTSGITRNTGSQPPGSTGAYDIILNAGGTVALGSLNAFDAVRVTAAALTGTSSSILANRNVTVGTTGNAQFGSIESVLGSIAVTAGGSVTGTSATTRAAGMGGSFIGATGVTLDSIRIPGAVLLRALGGNVMVSDLRSGPVTALGQAVSLTTTATTTIASAEATAGAVTLRGSSGDLIVNNATASGAFNATTDSGALSVGTANAASIALTSATTVALTGTVTATNMLAVNSRGATSVTGTATGGNVRITSGDIVIGSSGRIGTTGTTALLELINGDSGARTFIGGNDQAGEYSLSAAEMTRLFGNDITIRAQRVSSQGSTVLGSTRPPDVVIGAFTFNGGGGGTGAQLGSGGTLSIVTPGAARVVGAAQLTNMTSTNGFAVTADESIEVILGQGSVRLTGTGPNGLGGTLRLQSADIAVATAGAITAIAGLTDTDAIDARLAQNDGITSNDGALSAGTLDFAVTGGLYIQNSGASDEFADRRGFTTNALRIATTGSSARIVINGQIANSAGVLTTGIDAIPLMFINGVAGGRLGGYDSRSTLNGCIISNPASCNPVEFESGFPVQDIVQEEVDEEEDGGEGSQYQSLITIREASDTEQNPLLDDPVTGSGNDDLWTPPAEP